MRFGPFTIERVLGAGAMATVYAAHHDKLGHVALKVAMEPKHGPALERGHALLHRFDHPDIPRPLGYFEVAGRPTLCMSMLNGVPYTDQEESRSDQRMVGLMISLLALLDHVHRRGVVHCDVKRQNVLVGDRAQLLDFGIARDVGAPAADSLGQVAGTLAYMAPEVLEGREVVPQTDLYSMGVLIYHSLTGRFPFPQEPALHLIAKQDRVWLPPTTLRPELPGEVDDLLFQLLAPTPAERPTSGMLRSALRALVPLLPDCASGVFSKADRDFGGTTRDLPQSVPTPPSPPASSVSTIPPSFGGAPVVSIPASGGVGSSSQPSE